MRKRIAGLMAVMVALMGVLFLAGCGGGEAPVASYTVSDSSLTSAIVSSKKVTDPEQIKGLLKRNPGLSFSTHTPDDSGTDYVGIFFADGDSGTNSKYFAGKIGATVLALGDYYDCLVNVGSDGLITLSTLPQSTIDQIKKDTPDSGVKTGLIDVNGEPFNNFELYTGQVKFNTTYTGNSSVRDVYLLKTQSGSVTMWGYEM